MLTGEKSWLLAGGYQTALFQGVQVLSSSIPDLYFFPVKLIFPLFVIKSEYVFSLGDDLNLHIPYKKICKQFM